ncbi:MAG: 3-oxoacyl-[acyl-carrier-protein] synthase III C-terminal domain-containing protein [Pseudomonadota bacterium]|nr:3-oxoacyl-[acyl-carrier-protein] synthase III C-terminal domain-containing protein [Pseudomonadota bacterium]
MNLPSVWLAPPAVRLPEIVRTNDDLLRLVHAEFRGTEEEWAPVNRRIRSLLRACGTNLRHWEPAPLPLAGHAAAASATALAAAGLTADALDLVLYGSLAREYFEPATASEVALLLGADRALALDLTAACAGSLLAVQDFVARAAVDDSIRTGLVCTSTMTPPGFVKYGIQTADEVALLGAGLTLGNAASATVLTTTRPTGGGGRVRAFLADGMSAHHALCRAEIHGHFVSDGPAIFALAQHMPGHVRRLCDRAGWSVGEVDLFVTHQPSNSVLRAIAGALEVSPDIMPALHGLYGNCAESSVPLALRHALDNGRIRPGSKLVLAAAASGFVMASLAVEWDG